MSVITTPDTITVTDYEFIFLGGTKLSHTIGPEDTFVEVADRYLLSWKDVHETAEIFMTNILQKGTRVRKIILTTETAVQKVVREIKAKEAAGQMAVGTASTAPQE